MSSLSTGLNRWAILLTRTVRGRTVLANIKHDRHVPAPVCTRVQRFLGQLKDEIESRWLARIDSAERDPGAWPDPTDVVEVAVSPHHCRGEPLSAPTDGCSRVMAAQDFLTYNFAGEDFVSPISDEPDPAALEGLERSLVGKVRGHMENGRGFAWITRTGYVQASLRANAAQVPATTMRDRLGLVHMGKGIEMVEIQYPPTAFASGGLFRPTFIEGGAGRSFTSKFGADDWGVAVNLESCADGGPEAVHERLPLGNGTGFKLRRLARIDTPANEDPNCVHRCIVPGSVWLETDRLSTYL